MMFGLPSIDLIECQRDSPQFRQNLETHERNLDSLELKLEKIVKQCAQMVNVGRLFNQEQEQLVNTMWELSNYFSGDTTVQGSLNCVLNALREATNYQRILIDQASRSIIKKFNEFNRCEIKNVKERKHWFEKASVEMDVVLHRSSSVTKGQDSGELNKQVWATRQAFRHTAIDYMHAITIAQAKKRYQVVDAILSYTKSFNTFYHQGSDLFDDMKVSLDKISTEVSEMTDLESDLEKSMENRHVDITGSDVILPNEKRNSSYPVSMQGYLFKRTNNAFKSWNRRYFTLQNNQLVYRKRTGEEVTVMEDDLRLCSVKPAADVERRFCFEVTSNTKSHVLQAESEESCQEWIEHLIRGISSALQHNDYSFHEEAGYSRLNTQSPTLSSTSNSPYSPIHSNNSPSGQVPNRNKLWRDVLNIPGNDVCCDCESSDPKWASINLGITLCIECSGIHRSLGVHISKVRSLTLDKWDIEVMRVMEAQGNDRINQIYLSNHRSESTGITQAAPGCIRSVRENWIKAKYLEKSFVAPITVESIFDKIFENPCIAISLSEDDREKSQAILDISDSLTACLEKAAKIDYADSQSESIKKDLLEELNNVGSLTADRLFLSASHVGHIPLMCFSLACGAKKDNTDEKGRSALHYAVYSKCPIAVEYLLLNGVKVDVQDENGKSPLHSATIQLNILQVYRLIKYRSNWKIKDNVMKTAIDYALESNEPDLVTLLRVATLSEQLDKEDVDDEMNSIMQELHRKKSPLLPPSYI